jgi:hypothetical protein
VAVLPPRWFEKPSADRRMLALAAVRVQNPEAAHLLLTYRNALEEICRLEGVLRSGRHRNAGGIARAMVELARKALEE